LASSFHPLELAFLRCFVQEVPFDASVEMAIWGNAIFETPNAWGVHFVGELGYNPDLTGVLHTCKIRVPYVKLT
jgi:hypothetical protein